MHLLLVLLVCVLALESVHGKCKVFETAVKCFNAEEKDLPNSIHENITRMNLHNSKVLRIQKSFLKNLPDLIEFTADEGGIETIDKDAFMGLTELYWVDLGNNSLSQLDPDILLHNKKVFYVSLSGNNLIVPKEEPILNPKSAEWLYAESCGIKEVTVETFKGLPNMSALSLARNLLETLPEGVFKNNPNLEWLDLSSNKFSTLSPVALTGIEAAIINFKENPWKCDCHLTPLILWSKENLLQSYVSCIEPLTEVWQNIENPPQCP